MKGFKEELRYQYDLNKDSVVFDLGGYKGEWSEGIHARFGCVPYLYEPVFKISGNFIFHPYGLGAYSRGEVILVDADKTGIACKSGRSQKIKIVDVAAELEEVQSIDLMKINIEGMEYELLPRLIETGLISRIKNIQVQFHNIVPESDRLMWTIQNELKNTHEQTWGYRFVWENWRLK